MAFSEINDGDVVYNLRDRNESMVRAWQSVFSDYKDNVKVSYCFCVRPKKKICLFPVTCPKKLG